MSLRGELNGCGRVVVDGRYHFRVSKIFAGFIGRKDQVNIVCGLRGEILVPDYEDVTEIPT